MYSHPWSEWWTTPVGFRLATAMSSARQHELGSEVPGHRPADDAAAEYVEDDGEVEEAGASRDVGDVRDPERVGPVGCEVALDEVGPRRRHPAGGRRRATPPGDADDAGSRISRATRFLPTRTPSACRSAWTRGAPYVPSDAACAARIASVISASRLARADGGRSRHA